MNNSSQGLGRRAFLKGAGAALITGPFITRSLLANPPSGRVRHASFGTAGMAWADIQEIGSHPNVDVVAAAEVDMSRAEAFRKKFPNARIYTDFRTLLDAEQIDSVNVTTPDHMHAPMAMAAMHRGIHVYGQKPLTHDLYEARRVAETAHKRKLVTQMGIQIHS
jgi:predicted dehydrogenase